MTKLVTIQYSQSTLRIQIQNNITFQNQKPAHQFTPCFEYVQKWHQKEKRSKTAESVQNGRDKFKTGGIYSNPAFEFRMRVTRARAPLLELRLQIPLIHGFTREKRVHYK